MIDPDPDRLLHAIRARVDDAMLLELARADYGEDVDQHLAPLRTIRDAGVLPIPMEWHPKEVLELIRWSMPDDPEWGPGGHGDRGHLMRTFACAALIRSAAEPEQRPYVLDENATLAQLVDSVLALGGDLPAAAADTLAWRLERLGPHEDRPFFALALLLLAALAPLSGVDLTSAARRVIDEEAAERAAQAPHFPGGGSWLLGLTPYDLRHDGWRDLARRLMEAASDFEPRERAVVEEVAGRLLPGA